RSAAPPATTARRRARRDCPAAHSFAIWSNRCPSMRARPPRGHRGLCPPPDRIAPAPVGRGPPPQRRGAGAAPQGGGLLYWAAPFSGADYSMGRPYSPPPPPAVPTASARE